MSESITIEAVTIVSGLTNGPLTPPLHKKFPLIFNLHTESGSSNVHKVQGSKSTSSKLKPLKALSDITKLSSTGTSKNEIKFYNRDEPYYEFTNFYLSPVCIDDTMWPSTEHYFQAQKFVGTPYVDVIRRLPTPRDAFQLSREPNISRWRRSDWDRVKDDIMLKALKCKFQPKSKLGMKLLATGDKTLIEHTYNDSYWGDGGGGGLNKLGQLLMTVRDELRSKFKGSSVYVREDRVPSGNGLKRQNSFSTGSDYGYKRNQQPSRDDSTPSKRTVTFSPLTRSASLSNLSSLQSAPTHNSPHSFSIPNAQSIPSKSKSVGNSTHQKKSASSHSGRSANPKNMLHTTFQKSFSSSSTRHSNDSSGVRDIMTWF